MARDLGGRHDLHDVKMRRADMALSDAARRRQDALRKLEAADAKYKAYLAPALKPGATS